MYPWQWCVESVELAEHPFGKRGEMGRAESSRHVSGYCKMGDIETWKLAGAQCSITKLAAYEQRHKVYSDENRKTDICRLCVHWKAVEDEEEQRGE